MTQENIEEATAMGLIWLWPVLAVAAIFMAPFALVIWAGHSAFMKLLNVKPIAPKKERLEKQIIDARAHLRELEAEAELPQRDLNDAAWRDFEANNT